MSSETSESPLGTPHPDEPSTGGTPSHAPASGPSSMPSSTSSDELSLSLAASMAAAKPDPLLGEFHAEEATTSPPVEPAPEGEAPPAEPAPTEAIAAAPETPAGEAPPPIETAVTAPPAEPRDAKPIPDVSIDPAPVDGAGLIQLTTSETDICAVMPPLPATVAVPGSTPIEAFAAPSTAGVAAEVAAAGSFDAFPSFDLNATPAPKATEKAKKDAEEELDDEEYEDAPRWMAWVLPLLISYASAVTIGLAWVLITGRTLSWSEKTETDFMPPVDERPDPGKRADKSRKIEPPKPIPSTNIAPLGKSVKLGQIEVTPLEVARGPVTLQRIFNPSERKDGGGEALKLKLRLRNASSDTILFPLDEAFLRERAHNTLDSFIDTGDENKRIDMFPLAVESEWGIVGQEFLELEPGKSYETWVVSATDPFDRQAPEMTWRVRLRTDINKTDILGVRFRADEIKKGS
jgi:hypothetical protein